jgi:hypothetical protein
MRLKEIAQPKKSKLKTYEIRIKIPGTDGTTTNTRTTVMAVNPQMARKIIANQYDSTHVLIGQPREIKSR